MIALVALLISPASVAQSILIAEHRDKYYPVVSAKGMRPLIEVEGKRVVAQGTKFALRPVPDFLPVFVSVRRLKVHSSNLQLIDSGQAINNEFHFTADFESPYSLDDVFLVLELNLEN